MTYAEFLHQVNVPTLHALMRQDREDVCKLGEAS